MSQRGPASGAGPTLATLWCDLLPTRAPTPPHLATVVQHKHLAVLKRRHGPRVHIEVGVCARVAGQQCQCLPGHMGAPRARERRQAMRSLAPPARPPILMDVTRCPQAFSSTPMLEAVTPLPSPLTTPPAHTQGSTQRSWVRAGCPASAGSGGAARGVDAAGQQASSALPAAHAPVTSTYFILLNTAKRAACGWTRPNARGGVCTRRSAAESSVRVGVLPGAAQELDERAGQARGRGGKCARRHGV